MFYFISHSINIKITGKYPQSERILHNYRDNPLFLNNIYFREINFSPITPIPILHKKAKITDLISNVNAGGNLHLIISGKLKTVLNNYRIKGLQFFKTLIIKNNLELDDYFSMNMYQDNMEYINFKKSKINVRIRKKEGGTELTILQIDNLSDFLKIVDHHKEKMETVTVSNIFLNDNINEDFFMLQNVEGGTRYIVSENLKKEIEDAGCTGIEFQPVELSTTEWLHGGEREKIYGKA